MDYDLYVGYVPSSKKRKKTNAPGPSQPKNAVCALNELRPGLEYQLLSQIGPVHSPVFTIRVEVRNIKYVQSNLSL
jgi:double stranded RNA-specific editase B